MKYLVISDIHGSAESLEKALDCFGKQADYLLLCGGYLNHGPRNPLPEGWNPKSACAETVMRKLTKWCSNFRVLPPIRRFLIQTEEFLFTTDIFTIAKS